jgi:hypothetical protein
VALDVGVAEALDLLVLVLVDQRDARGVAGPAVTHIVGDVVELGDVPLERLVDLVVGLAALNHHGKSPGICSFIAK